MESNSKIRNVKYENIEIKFLVQLLGAKTKELMELDSAKKGHPSVSQYANQMATCVAELDSVDNTTTNVCITSGKPIGTDIKVKSPYFILFEVSDINFIHLTSEVFAPDENTPQDVADWAVSLQNAWENARPNYS